MNIFVLDRNPMYAAKYMCDKHIIKMALETAQILSTVLRKKGIKDKGLYKMTHINHPCVLWAEKSLGNFNWLCTHGLGICSEYRARYKRDHKSLEVILRASKLCPIGPQHWNKMKLIKPPKCMPEDVIKTTVVASYRAYYNQYKSGFATWKIEVPFWFDPQ